MRPVSIGSVTLGKAMGTTTTATGMAIRVASGAAVLLGAVEESAAQQHWQLRCGVLGVGLESVGFLSCWLLQQGGTLGCDSMAVSSAAGATQHHPGGNARSSAVENTRSRAKCRMLDSTSPGKVRFELSDCWSILTGWSDESRGSRIAFFAIKPADGGTSVADEVC